MVYLSAAWQRLLSSAKQGRDDAVAGVTTATSVLRDLRFMLLVCLEMAKCYSNNIYISYIRNCKIPSNLVMAIMPIYSTTIEKKIGSYSVKTNLSHLCNLKGLICSIWANLHCNQYI